MTDQREAPRDDSPDGPSGHPGRRQYIRPVVFLVVAAVSLYLLLPSLVSVFSSWRSLEHLDPSYLGGPAHVIGRL